MIFIIFLLFFRLKKPIGEVPYLPKLENETQLDLFVNSQGPSMIIFLPENKTYSLNFAEFAISEYKDKINFALASSELSKSRSFSNHHATFIGYISGKPVYYNGNSRTSFLEPTAFNIISYCKYLSGGRTKRLASPEEIRKIIEGHEIAVIGVDRAPKPKNFPKNEIFYQTLSALFRHFNINVSAGVYVYRPADRQLIRVNNNNYKVYTKTYLTDISYILNNNISHLTDKKYIAGYFMTNNNESLANKENQILNQFARNGKYKDKFYFSTIPKNKDNLICKVGRFCHFNSPSFIIIETQFLVNDLDKESEFSKNARRWIVSDPNKVHDSEHLSELINSILENEKKSPTLVSEEIIDNSNASYSIPIQMKANYNNFDQIIEANRNKENDCFIVFLKEDLSDYLKIVFTIKKAQEFLNNQKVKFLFFDVSKNDLPELIYSFQKKNKYIEFPFIARFPAKEKETLDNIEFYQSSFDFGEIMNWVSIHSSSQFKLPEFNETAITDEIIKEIPRKKKNITFSSKKQVPSKEQNREL